MLKKILLATHNSGKIKELRTMLSPFNIEVISASELKLPNIEETGTTFAENAALKAEALSALTNLPCLADDSGLCVDALDGRPGVYSARYAPERNFDIAMDKLIAELKESGKSDWSAHFSCILAFKEPQKETCFFEGRVDGKIIDTKKGAKGFGFDPIFMPNGFTTTFAEMSAEQKAAISHRGKALQQFIKKVSEAV